MGEYFQRLHIDQNAPYCALHICFIFILKSIQIRCVKRKVTVLAHPYYLNCVCVSYLRYNWHVMVAMILIPNFKKYYTKNLQWASELQNFGYHSTWHCFPVLKFTKKYSSIWIVNWLHARYVQFLKKVLNWSGSKQNWIMYHNLQFGRNVCIPLIKLLIGLNLVINFHNFQRKLPTSINDVRF